MTIMEIPAEARAAVRARRRKEIDELDYRRELRRLGERGYTQRRTRAASATRPALSIARSWSTSSVGGSTCRAGRRVAHLRT